MVANDNGSLVFASRTNPVMTIRCARHVPEIKRKAKNNLIQELLIICYTNIYYIDYIHVCIRNMITKGSYLGEFEELVLLSVAALPDEAYGVSIMNYIIDETGRSVNISAVHEVLKRLQRKGYLKSSMGGATEERGGRRKRFFTLTVGGKKILEETMKLKLQLYKQVPNLSFKIA
jgi:DNA-binding PadR family transcriptional regulator